jgi:hypothetical protein
MKINHIIKSLPVAPPLEHITLGDGSFRLGWRDDFLANLPRLSLLTRLEFSVLIEPPDLKIIARQAPGIT